MFLVLSLVRENCEILVTTDAFVDLKPFHLTTETNLVGDTARMLDCIS